MNRRLFLGIASIILVLIPSPSSLSHALCPSLPNRRDTKFRPPCRHSVCLTSTNGKSRNNENQFARYWHGAIATAANKFSSRPSAYLTIPVIAAFVGWFTNYLAVQMIFYPIHFKGLNLWRKEEVPLGLLGWHGIVPCKTRAMSETMVGMVKSELLEIEGIFKRLDSFTVADVLSSEIPQLFRSVMLEFSSLQWVRVPINFLYYSLPGRTMTLISGATVRFLEEFATAMQDNAEALLNVNNCVIDQMFQDRALLGILFRKCGQSELDFLTNSGLWFGFLLGLIQMVVALFCENPWTLSFGGTIVGLATNWLALKWIFEPVNPTKVGPFLLQGQFLRRQLEVANEFSAFFSTRVLTGKRLLGSILSDASTSLSFDLLFVKNFRRFVSVVTGGFGFQPCSVLVSTVARQAVGKLPSHLRGLNQYVDGQLGLQHSLRTQMEQMTSAKFERVLHPIFEEDELTLILAGGFLGFIAGLVQQGIETGHTAKLLARVRERISSKFGRFHHDASSA